MGKARGMDEEKCSRQSLVSRGHVFLSVSTENGKSSDAPSSPFPWSELYQHLLRTERAAVWRRGIDLN